MSLANSAGTPMAPVRIRCFCPLNDTLCKRTENACVSASMVPESTTERSAELLRTTVNSCSWAYSSIFARSAGSDPCSAAHCSRVR